MSSQVRPKGITETAVLMSFTNALGWFIIDWSKPGARGLFFLFIVAILAGHWVIWRYWSDRNWARLPVLLTFLLALHNLRYILQPGITKQVMISTEAILAAFLVYWLNTQPVRSFFRRD